jgi:acetyltransferase
MTTEKLETLLHPRGVVVIGGSTRHGAVGTTVLNNLLGGGFSGPVSVVNPKPVFRDGVHWVRSLADLAEMPELAVIATPAATVPALVDELGRRGVRVAVILSAGLDPAQRGAMLAAAGRTGLRLIGPNSLGVIVPDAQCNASFAAHRPLPGRLAFLSQSGALVAAMIEWASGQQCGFSALVSVGDMADVDVGDLVDLYAADPGTDAILLYLEHVTNAAKFLSAARAATRVKPVIAIMAGRSDAAARAARTHSGALAGGYDVSVAALRRAGIIVVDGLTALFDAAQVVRRYRPAECDRLAIVTNGGGAGVLAADAVTATGGALATLAPATLADLDGMLPQGWSRANPIDVIGDADAARVGGATAAALADPGVDAVLVIHCPTAVAIGNDVAAAMLSAVAAQRGRGPKPVIGCWLGSRTAAAVQGQFELAGVPLFDTLDDAVRGFGYLRQAALGRKAVLKAPARASVPEHDRALAQANIGWARSEHRTMLHSVEARAVLAAYGIPTVAARLARDPAAVAAACQTLTGPFALKIVSPDLAHKTDVGGVALDLPDAAAAVAAAQAMLQRIAHEHPEACVIGFEVEPMVRAPHAIELLVGLADDPVFGPVVTVGAGGEAVELLADRALELPPLDDALARDMIARTRVSRLLAGYRHVPPADLDAVVRVINAVSAIAVDLPDIVELDINPLLVHAGGAVALDYRIRIAGTPQASRLAIRPVPTEWAADLVTRSGLALHVRPVEPTDERALAELFEHVAPEDLRFRFLSGLREVGRDRLVAMTQVDYRRTINFLAFAGDTLVATAMLARDPALTRAELAVSVRADRKGQGVSWTLVDHVLRYARAEGIETIESVESIDNHAALSLEREMGFETVAGDEAGERIVRYRVATAPSEPDHRRTLEPDGAGR